MSSKELIIYILENNLEGALIMSVEQAAVKLNTGPATIEARIKLDTIKAIKIGETYLVFIERKDER